MKINKFKLIIAGAITLFALILFIFINPFSYNDPTERTVITRQNGKQFVQFSPGMYYSGFFAKEVSWPNQISVSYKDEKPNYELVDNTVEIGRVLVRFNDATTAEVQGITQYILPSDEKEMLEIHNAHRTPEALVKRRLAPYTQECLQSSAQLMSSEMHYSGGRAQMVQDYLDQLKAGAFLLKISTVNIYDSIEKSNKKSYEVVIQKDAGGQFKRKFSSIKEYGVIVADAQVTDVDYEAQVDTMLKKKIAAATRSSISKQELMTAQQMQLTAEAQGKKKLVEIEYVQKQEQTKQVVAAQTQVELAKLDLTKQDIALQAANKEGQKIKVLADANAYEKQRNIAADGALDKKLDAWLQERKYAWDAFAKYQGNMVPYYISGGGNGNVPYATQWLEIQGINSMNSLKLDMKNK